MVYCLVADQPLGAIAETNVKAVDNVHNIVRQTTSSDAVVKRLSRKSSGNTNGIRMFVFWHQFPVLLSSRKVLVLDDPWGPVCKYLSSDFMSLSLFLSSDHKFLSFFLTSSLKSLSLSLKPLTTRLSISQEDTFNKFNETTNSYMLVSYCFSVYYLVLVW